MVMENRPVDPGSIYGSHRPISFIRTRHRTRADDILCKTDYSINNHIVGLVHKKHIIRMSLMYHADCKVEFQPFKTVVLTAEVFQVFIKYSKNWLSRTNLQSFLTPKVDSRLKPSNYVATPSYLHVYRTKVQMYTPLLRDKTLILCTCP